MSARDERRVDEARRKLDDALGGTDRLLPGSLIERAMRCGKPNCRCAADPPQLHGPYMQWSYTQGSRRITRWLNAEQQERYCPRVQAGRALRALLSELENREVHSVEQAEGWGT